MGSRVGCEVFYPASRGQVRPPHQPPQDGGGPTVAARARRRPPAPAGARPRVDLCRDR